jgi:Zn-dependent peptidase ImmA (M78 family)
MLKSKIDEIETKTREILGEVIGNLDDLQPPINLAKILENFELSLEQAKFTQFSVGGAFDREKKTIYLAVDESPIRQAFTVAHELGHLILHKKKQELFFRHQAKEFNGDSKEDKPSNDDEKEANWFAAALLMPKEMVEKAWENYKSIELLAQYFGVSRQAAFWRIKNLGLLR